MREDDVERWLCGLLVVAFCKLQFESGRGAIKWYGVQRNVVLVYVANDITLLPYFYLTNNDMPFPSS